MAGRGLRRTSVLAVTVATAIGAGAAPAEAGGGLTGSRAAVRVAQHVLAHIRHVTAIRWLQGGDQWECPSGGGPIVGPALRRPARNCRRATVSFDENLRHGRITRSVATTTARGLATESELVTSSGDWMRSGGAHCWEAEGAGLVNEPAFSYAGERLRISARTAHVITLRGAGGGVRETDAIDALTFAVREVDVRVPGIGGSAELVGRFSEQAHPFALPRRPRRVCSDIVRFPPHPSR
ncbi:MAG TPA: hypothetical protein VGF68_03210 [Solirubrobacteraceae bacterium]|jgi:hypothetical protein